MHKEQIIQFPRQKQSEIVISSGIGVQTSYSTNDTLLNVSQNVQRTEQNKIKRTKQKEAKARTDHEGKQIKTEQPEQKRKTEQSKTERRTEQNKVQKRAKQDGEEKQT